MALISAKGGNGPADISQSPVVGRWAGKRVLIQGDYAEDNDIPGWNGPPLTQLYTALSDPAEKKPNPSQLVFADLSDSIAGFLEGACSVRFFGDGWRDCVQVKPNAKEFGSSGIGEYVIADIYSADALAYFKRQGLQPIDIQRVPRSRDWHG